VAEVLASYWDSVAESICRGHPVAAAKVRSSRPDVFDNPTWELGRMAGGPNSGGGVPGVHEDGAEADDARVVAGRGVGDDDRRTARRSAGCRSSSHPSTPAVIAQARHEWVVVDHLAAVGLQLLHDVHCPEGVLLQLGQLRRLQTAHRHRPLHEAAVELRPGLSAPLRHLADHLSQPQRQNPAQAASMARSQLQHPDGPIPFPALPDPLPNLPGVA